MSCTNSEVMLTTKVGAVTVTLSRVWLVWNERDNCSFQIKRSDEQTVSVCYFEGEAVALFHQTVSDLRDEPANYLREIASRQKDSQKMITKRIIGRWLHKRGVPVVGNRFGRYVIDNGAIKLKFQVYEDGTINTFRFYTGLAGIESLNGLSALLTAVKEMDKE